MIKDLLNAKGVFGFTILDAKTGDILQKYEDNNLVVTLGHGNIAKLLGGNPSGLAITKIALGTNGTPPALTDNTITGAFTKSITAVSYPDTNSVRFSWEIDATEANGMTIREFGLLTSSDVLCARKVRDGEIVKTAAVRLVGTWKITINS
jgi:hypothetical protein